MEATKIEVLHSEHREWLNKIDFYYDELKVFRRRLDEIATKNSDIEVLKLVEHFQNQFLIQRNELDELKHATQEAEQLVVNSVKQNEIAFHRRTLMDDGTLRIRVTQFEKLFHQLRSEFIAFVAKTF